MQLRDVLQFVGPDDPPSARRNAATLGEVAHRNLVGHRLVLRVADIEAAQLDFDIGVVVELNPVVLLPELVGEHVIGRTHLIHTNREVVAGDALRCRCNGLETGFEGDGRCAQRDDAIGADVRAIGHNRLIGERRVPKDVRRSGRVVVYLDADGVRALVEEVLGQCH